MQLVSRTPHMDFAAYGLMLVRGRGDIVQSVEISKHEPTLSRRIEMILRAAVDAGTTSDPTWAGALADHRQVSAAFVESLRNISVLDAVLPFARRLPLRTPVAVVTAGMSGFNPAEGKPKPISKMVLAADALEPKKATTLVVVTDEVLRFSTSVAIDLLHAELRGGVATTTNSIFLADLAAGITPINSTADPLADLRTGLAVVATHSIGRYFWVVDPLSAVYLSTYPGAGGEPAFPAMSPNGGTIGGVSVLVAATPQDSSGPMSLVVDATKLAIGDEPVTLRASRYATIELDDDPADGPVNATSLFQTNSVALLAERFFASHRLHASAVAAISGADYSS